MKIIKTSDLKEIGWLNEKKCAIIGNEGEVKIFEVEEDLILPRFEEGEKKTEKPKAKSESNQEVNNSDIVKDKTKKLKDKKSGKKKSK